VYYASPTIPNPHVAKWVCHQNTLHLFFCFTTQAVTAQLVTDSPISYTSSRLLEPLDEELH